MSEKIFGVTVGGFKAFTSWTFLFKACCSAYQCRLQWTSVSPKLWKKIWHRSVLSFTRKTQKPLNSNPFQFQKN